MLRDSELKLIKHLEGKEQSAGLWIFCSLILMVGGMLIGVVLAQKFPPFDPLAVLFSILGIWTTASGFMVLGVLVFQLRLLAIVKKLQAMAEKENPPSGTGK